MCYTLSYDDGTLFALNQNTDRVWGQVQPPFNADDLAVYFLGPVMGLVLRQRHVTCLHASTMELHGQGVLFCGDAGYGKSTTAGALALRGVPVLAENIAPLQLTPDEIWVRPGYPRVCLWPEAVEKIVGEATAMPKLTAAWEKRFLALDGIRAKFANEKAPRGTIYIIGERSGDENAPRVEEVSLREALLDLVKRTYMNAILDRRRRAEEFEVLGKSRQKIPVRRLTAHKNAEKIGALCDLILADADQLLRRVAV